jgi:two-component system CAI-1 autoinducer sensor kinase/phosphatase CqsS
MVIPREGMRDMLERSRLAIRWGGILGLLCHPIYYVVWTYVLPQPYDSLFLRLSAAFVCIPLIFQGRWPKKFNHYLLIYWYCCLIYVLPFACTFLAIRNSFSTMWMMTEVMMIFIMALCIDNPLLLMACISVGVFSGAVGALVNSPVPIVLSAANRSDLALFPVVVLCSMAFCQAISKGRIFFERTQALQAVAGSIAHEMRNPLSQVRHVLDIVEEALPDATGFNRSKGLSQATAAHLFRHLAQGRLSIDRGLRIIAMTLDEVSAKPIRPDSLTYQRAGVTTRKALDEYGFDNDKERSKVKLHVLEDFTFKVDETVYLFTLFNLIKNALHHIATRPSATLTLTVDKHAVVVHDTGPGISPDIIPHLFEPFRTAGNSDGTGLGLAYCQRAMRAFGGTISCRSDSESFTEFTLQFPVVTDREVFDHERGIFERAIPLFEGKRVLIVDDDPAQRAKVRRALSKVRAQVSEAENGQLALVMIREGAWKYDLVLMDVNMPVMDGYTATEKIRADHRHPVGNLLIVGYTAEPGNAARVLARRAGMDDTITKSGSMMDLIVTLQTIFENGSRNNPGQTFDGFAGRSILVADDDTYSRLVAKGYLERGGANVVEAEHGQAVLNRLQENASIDAIVMDMNMPGMGGVEATALIRARTDSYAKVPIIALTSQSDIKAVQTCLAAGMDEVMVKPVQIGSLYAALARQFARQRVLNAMTTAEPSLMPDTDHAHELGIGEPLLDEIQLIELVALDLVDQAFLDGIEQIRALMARISTSAAADDIESAHGALHLLLGVTGSIGAKALHQYAKQIYPEVVGGEWPTEPDWLTRICTLSDHSVEALQKYYRSSKARPDHRDALSKG